MRSCIPSQSFRASLSIRPLLCLLAALPFLLPCDRAFAEGPVDSVGPGLGVLQDDGAEGRGGTTLVFHADGSYENGYAWRYGGIVPPDYGAFAEKYPGEVEVTSALFDFSQVGNQVGQVMDVYIWDDAGGTPGAVACVVVDVDPGPIAFWPSLSRHEVPMPNCPTTDPWWVGSWTNWPQQISGWFIGADVDGNPGTPVTNYAPGIGFPTGWNDVSAAWGATQSLGIGAYVQSPPPPPTTLQSMIDAASEGETVLVPAGTYMGIGNKRLDFGGKNITLRAEAGPASTIIDCQNDGRAFHFHSGETSESVVEGFTILRGRVLGAQGRGAAVLIEDGSTPTFQNCVFEEGYATRGGVFEVADGGLYLYDSLLESNRAEENGGAGGIRSVNSNLVLENVRILDAFQGGLAVVGGSLEMEGGEIRGCYATHAGSGVRLVQSATAMVQHVVVSGNAAINGGGFHVDPSSELTLNRSTVSSNSASNHGGGIDADGTVTMDRSIVWNNCSASGGTDLDADPGSIVTVSCGATSPSGTSGAVNFVGSQVMTNPLLCDPVDCEQAPTVLGNVHLSESSECLPVNSPCGNLIGPLWIRCPFPQIPTGACCLPDECFLTAATLCDPFGGSYQGDGTTCSPGECAPSNVENHLTGIDGIRLEVLGPNPAPSEVRFAIVTESPEELSLDVFDPQGRRVSRVFEATVAIGRHEAEWDGRGADGQELPAGVYYMRLSNGEERLSRSIVLTR